MGGGPAFKVSRNGGPAPVAAGRWPSYSEAIGLQQDLRRADELRRSRGREEWPRPEVLVTGAGTHPQRFDALPKAAKLYEEGKLGLNDPVSDFIPAFADMRVYAGGSDVKQVTVPATEPVRVWHLLTHPSGLTYGSHRTHPVHALYRPGALSVGMVEEYIQRKQGRKFTYSLPETKPILEETYGVEIADHEVVPAHFGTIRSIDALLSDKLPSAPAGSAVRSTWTRPSSRSSSQPVATARSSTGSSPRSWASSIRVRAVVQ